jgi:hypothetical protein
MPSSPRAQAWGNISASRDGRREYGAAVLLARFAQAPGRGRRRFAVIARASIALVTIITIGHRRPRNLVAAQVDVITGSNPGALAAKRAMAESLSFSSPRMTALREALSRAFEGPEAT